MLGLGKGFTTPTSSSRFRNTRIRPVTSSVITDEGSLADLYPFNCSFYQEPPEGSVSLQEFEDYAVARLTLLRIIERNNLTSHSKYSGEWITSVKNDVKKSKCDLVSRVFNHLMCPSKEKAYMTSTNPDWRRSYSEQLEARRIDTASHFILRLAFCRTEDLRKWFVSLEVDFFRLRFGTEANVTLLLFLRHYDLSYKKVNTVDQEQLKKNLCDAYFQITAHNIMSDSFDFYEVPFTQVPDMVRARKVYLLKGNAIIPHNELGTVVVANFRSRISKFLALTCKALPIVEEDERLVRLLTDFDKRYTGSTYVTKLEGDGISVEMLDDLSKSSFPLCMKSLYDVVAREHHLKHWGRLQLGLFFKAINLSMEESIRYWRSNFTKKAGLDGTGFDKQYLYNIRHMYGQEGKRADYTPYSCSKIIMSAVGPGDHHGCPFRHSDATPLRAKLADANITPAGIKEIMELIEAKQYQFACQKYFEWTHNKGTIEGGLNHPNQYFEESRLALRGDVKPSLSNKNLKKTVSKQYPKSQEGPSTSTSSVTIKQEPATLDEVDLDFINAALADDDEDDEDGSSWHTPAPGGSSPAPVKSEVPEARVP